MDESGKKQDQLMVQYEGNGDALGKIFEKVSESRAREAFFHLYTLFKDHTRDTKAAHEKEMREQADKYEAKIDELKDKLTTFIRDDEERQRDLVRYQDSTRRVIKWACGLSLSSMMLVGAFEGHRYATDGSDYQLVDQLKARVESYDAVMQSREMQLERYMFSENEKFAGVLKAVDSLKNQVNLYDWYLKDDTRDLMERLNEFASPENMQLIHFLRSQLEAKEIENKNRN